MGHQCLSASMRQDTLDFVILVLFDQILMAISSAVLLSPSCSHLDMCNMAIFDDLIISHWFGMILVLHPSDACHAYPHPLSVAYHHTSYLASFLRSDQSDGYHHLRFSLWRCCIGHPPIICIIGPPPTYVLRCRACYGIVWLWGSMACLPIPPIAICHDSIPPLLNCDVFNIVRCWFTPLYTLCAPKGMSDIALQ